MQSKKVQLEKFGITLRKRRQALNLTMRELSELSGVSPALIAKLENGTMPNFPKRITIAQLSKALKFKGELFVLADILFDGSAKEPVQKTFEEELRELLATRTELNPDNVALAIHFIDGLQKLQKIDELED